MRLKAAPLLTSLADTEALPHAGKMLWAALMNIASFPLVASTGYLPEFAVGHGGKRVQEGQAHCPWWGQQSCLWWDALRGLTHGGTISGVPVSTRYGTQGS